MLQLQQVSKVYRSPRGEVKSLDRVSLQVELGEFVVIRGSSGCGKTTLLLTAGGMLRPSSGSVWLDRQSLYQLSSRERARVRASQVGFVFQMFHLVPYLTVLENTRLADQTDGKAAARRAEALLEELGLRPRLHHRPSELSAGERQRTALARALVHRPRLVLADEPAGNLDPANAAEVFRHLKQFQQAGGTVVVVTHGSAVEPEADRTVHLEAGRMVESA
jgi:putative ABC transport system ATP-binding protein